MAGQGLSSAAQQLQSYGRGRDTMLAHIAPDEAEFIDAIQGGRRTNPMTGLPEYGLFGKILKAVVRVGAGIGGFMLGGPAGAALASGAATKLTGGSWKQALKAGALSGIGSGVTQGLTGGGWNLTGTGTPLSNALGGGAANAGGSAGVGASISGAPSVAQTAAAAGMPTGATTGLGASLATAGGPGASIGTSPGFMSGLSSAAPAASGGLSSALSSIGGWPGAVAGLGGLSNPLTADDSGGPAPLSPNNININVKPFNRQQRPYTGDPLTAAEHPGGWQYFDNVNPSPEYLAHGGVVGGMRHYDMGGAVMGPRPLGGGIGGLGAPRALGIPSQIEAPHLQPPGQMSQQAMQMRDMSPGAQRAKLRQAAIMGYVSAKDGGAVSGPGGPEDDEVPAMLSNGEHVIDQKTVKAAGNGSLTRGHKAIERFKRQARKNAGYKNPSKPPAFGGA